MIWPEVTFESIFDIPTRNGIYKKKEFHGSGIPIVNMGELFSFNRIGNQPMSLIQVTPKEMETSGLLNGDLLFGRRSLVEDGAGKCSVVHGLNGPTTFESSIIRVRLKKEIANPEFFFNYFRSPLGRSKIEAIVSGTAVKGIRGSDLKKILVHLPPIKTQNKIANLIAAYDDLISINQRRIALLEEAARRLYREWFVHLRFPRHESTRVIDGLPEGWGKLPLTKIANFINGFAFKPSHHKNEGLPIIKIPELRYGVTQKTPRTNDRDISEKFLVRTGDIIFSWSGTLIVKEWTGEEALLNQHLFNVIPKNKNTKRFIFFSIEHSIPSLINQSVGSTMQHIRRSSLDNHLITIPPTEILNKFSEMADPLMNLALSLMSMNSRLTKARDLLLPRLMSGKLDVSNIPLPEEVLA